ncbi:MAG: YbjN domain-containing protein [Bacteroidia bacterium]|nr:YbjN domain-containing protein [Bacteroidia bacterium]
MTKIPFGRYSDGFKAKSKSDKWNECDIEYAQKNYSKSYPAFMEYLKDDELDNVKYTINRQKINFEIFQGSKVLRGYIDIDNQRIVAEAPVAKLERKSVAAMRRLLEMNFNLNYTRFCLKEDDTIVLKYDSNIEGGHPRKLYYAFKEAAVRADKQDDLLTADFTGAISMIDDSHIIHESEAHKEIKYKYLVKWINDFLSRYPQLEEKNLDGAIGYLVLSLIYKIDFLLSPEGKLMHDLEAMNQIYWKSSETTLRERNREIITILKEILSRDKAAVLKDFYHSIQTFGIGKPVHHDDVVRSICSANPNHEWYKENGYLDVAISVVEYGLSYCSFHYGLPDITKNWIVLMYQILEPDFFTEMGYSEKLYDASTNTFNIPAIMAKIYQIQTEAHHYFPYINLLGAGELKYTSLLDFLLSYTNAIANLNYQRAF